MPNPAPKPTKKPKPLEHDIQADFVREVLYKYRNNETFIESLFYAVPSGFVGGGRNKFALLNKLKREGWKNGIADFHYDQPRGHYSKMVIEFKREDKRNTKNGGLSDEQVTYLESIQEHAFTCICYSSEEAVQMFDIYMGLSVAKKQGAEFLRGFHSLKEYGTHPPSVNR